MRKHLSFIILFLFMVIFGVSGYSQNGIGGNNLLSGLSPESFWHYFNEITKIPRCSGNEEEIRQWIVEQAESLGLDSFVDDYGNVKIEKSASNGYEDHEGVVLQGHLDMVCSPASMTFPLQLEINNGWLTANNTTLGADNGVGIALALTVLADSSLKHPPLEVLFTVEEETGLDGANNLKEDFIRYRKLINLDSEEEGVITIGCAGGGRSYINMPLEREQPNNGMISLVISVNGLLGGHSGLEVDSRANPNKLIGEFLERANDVAPELRLVSIKSGEQDNVIPSESNVWIYLDSKNVQKLNNLRNELLNEWRDEFAEKEPHINIDIYRTEENYNPISKEITNNIIDLLNELPYGVIAWSEELENTIETSVNISPVKTYENSLEIVMMSRSASIESLNSLQERIKDIATSYGANCENPADDRYPPWEPNFDSELLALAEDVYNSLYGKIPETEVTHGGLETAVIGNIYMGMDMISVGPTIENAHSPEERLNIESVEKFYNYLLELLEAL